MANIQPQIDEIRNARYGRDVRESIATGLEAMNTESSEAYSAAITAQTSASNSATQASQSATDASNYASNASQSASNASASAQGIQTALTQAQSASASAQSASATAQTASNNAKASETSAKTSEANAKTSEQNANAYSTSAQNASTSAQNASASAQASATAASNSQTASATSAQNAKTSEENARQWAEQASSVVNIDVMTSSKNGIGRPDGTTITVDQFGVFKASGIADHESKQIASNNGVHGQRVLSGALQHWDDGLSKWVTDIEEVKVDGTTITKDTDGVLHGTSYTLPTASETTLGGVKIGDGIDITDGKISVDIPEVDMSIVSDEYVSGTTYSAGDFAIYNNKLWKCLVANSEAPSEGANWTETQVATEIKQINADLTDKKTVQLTQGTNCQWIKCEYVEHVDYIVIRLMFKTLYSSSASTQIATGSVDFDVSYGMTARYVPLYATYSPSMASLYVNIYQGAITLNLANAVYDYWYTGEVFISKQ